MAVGAPGGISSSVVQVLDARQNRSDENQKLDVAAVRDKISESEGTSFGGRISDSVSASDEARKVAAANAPADKNPLRQVLEQSIKVDPIGGSGENQGLGQLVNITA